MTVRRNIILNGIGQMGNRIVRIIEQLLMVPFFLTQWGAAYYGEWLTISIVPTVLAFSDLGFGTAVSNKFVLTYSNGNKQISADVYKTGLAVITATVLMGLVLCFAVIFFIWKSSILEKSLITPIQVVMTLMSLMGSRLVTFYSQLFEGFFRAKHKAALAFNLYSIDGILRIVVGMATLFAGCGVVGFALGQFIETIIFNLIFAFLALHFVKDLPKGKKNKEIAVDTLRIGMGFLLTPVWQGIYMQGTTFVVRIVLGPESVAVFNTVRTVCHSVHAMFTTVNGSIFPELQIAYGRDDVNSVKKIYRVSLQSVAIIGILGLIFLVLFGQYFYSWWTHNELNVDSTVWYIFMLSIPLNALWWTAGTVFRAINKPMKLSVCGFISSIMAALLSYAFANLGGLAGAALGYITMDLFMLAFILPMSMKEINLRMQDLFEFCDFGNEIRRLAHRK